MKRVKFLLYVLVINIHLGNTILAANAAERFEGNVMEINRLMTAVEDVEAKETPDAEAKGVIDYKEGSTVYVMGETDGWYQVCYQGTEGFVEKEFLKDIEVDLSVLEQEIEISENEGRIVVEETERVQSENNRTIVWLIVIAAVIVGIFLTGILITRIPSKRSRRRKRRKRRRK